MLKWLPAAAMVLTPSAACAEWWEARTDHFVVYSESSASEAKKVAERLERFDVALRSLQNIKFIPITSDSRRLTVFRTGDMGDIGRLAGSSGVAGFYIPRMGGAVAFTPVRDELRREISRVDSRTELDPQSVLFHEYAHHFMFQNSAAAYPAWYVEGIAENYATVELKDDGSFVLGKPPQYRADALFDINVPVKRMLASRSRPNGEDYYSYYTIGWLLVHYLTFEPSRQGQLKQYLRLINSGADPADAAGQAFGNLAKLDREIHNYKGGKLPGALVRPAGYSPPKVAMRKLAADEEAIMVVKMRSKRGVSVKNAQDVARDARSIANKYPQSFAVQLALAEAEFDADRLEAAEAAADRALALKPQSAEAMLYKGLVYLKRAEEDKSQLTTARTWFAKAYRANPEHAEPLYYNYLTYYHAGGAIPESALIGLERAFEYAPHDNDLRLVLVRQLLAEKKGPEAHQAIMPFALSPHQSKTAKTMHDIAELIQANKLDEAHSKLAAEMKRQEQKKKSGDDHEE